MKMIKKVMNQLNKVDRNIWGCSTLSMNAL